MCHVSYLHVDVSLHFRCYESPKTQAEQHCRSLLALNFEPLSISEGNPGMPEQENNSY